MAVKIFNNLPDRIKKIESLSSFIKTLKDFLLDKAYYSIEEYYLDTK